MNTYAEKSEKAAAQNDKTGIPRRMKTNFEHSSGFLFDDVRVHYNSEKPAQLHAHAYTRGNEVYVAPGQEKHLPHELGHVVQQKSDMVKPTGEIGGLPLNNDEAMENGADRIAKEAENVDNEPEEAPVQGKFKNGGVVQRATDGFYNVSTGLAALLGVGGGIFGYFHSSKEKYVAQIEDYADKAEEACREAEASCDEMLNENDQQKKIQKAINTKKYAQKAVNLSNRVAQKYNVKSTMKWSDNAKDATGRAVIAANKAINYLTQANAVLNNQNQQGAQGVQNPQPPPPPPQQD